MIILENRGFQNDIYLENKNQIVGSQTWIREYPSGLEARCHQYGDFSVEELQINPGVISFAQENLLDSFVDYSKILEIEDAWNNNVAGKSFSEEEWKVLLSDGFLGVLGKICPELEENEVFIFYTELNKKIKDLENEFRGRPYSDILEEFKNHSDNESDYKLWHAIEENYTSNYFWVDDFENGTGGIREKYLHFLEIEDQLKTKTPLQKKEDELSSLEEEEKTISEAEELIDKQTEKEGQDIGEE